MHFFQEVTVLLGLLLICGSHRYGIIFAIIINLNSGKKRTYIMFFQLKNDEESKPSSNTVHCFLMTAHLVMD